MNPEDKFFIVSSPDGRLNVRSTGEVENGNDLGDFDLINGDVIHAVDVEVSSGGVTFHRFDCIYRNGTRYDSPFNGFPKYVASTTGKYWVAEKAGTDAFMAETDNPESPARGSDTARKTINDPKSPSAKKYVGWRVLHKAEGGYDKNPLGMPGVIPPINPLALEMTEAIQRMSFSLMKQFNPAITPQLWTKIHDHDRAFTNHNGFAKAGDPRANYITGENLSSPLPKYDKMQRLCGGQFVRGEVRGDNLVCIPGVHGIDASKPLPSIQTIIDNNWYLFAITLTNASKVDHFPQGKGGPVVIPFIFDREIEFPLSLFEKWEADTLPDPLKIYRK
jgi:hypothetical protein